MKITSPKGLWNNHLTTTGKIVFFIPCTMYYVTYLILTILSLFTCGVELAWDDFNE